jgi:hypothetical protein
MQKIKIKRLTKSKKKNTLAKSLCANGDTRRGVIFLIWNCFLVNLGFKMETQTNFNLLSAPVPVQVWGSALIDQQALDQMDVAARLPVARAGAVMPDAHVGYGLPIGGVLATADAVIPYAVGVDIACRMRLSIVDLRQT